MWAALRAYNCEGVIMFGPLLLDALLAPFVIPQHCLRDDYKYDALFPRYPGGLPAAECGGAVRELAEGVPGGGDPLRQARRQLPGHGEAGDPATLPPHFGF